MEPFGEAWVNEMMKHTKRGLIAMLMETWKEREEKPMNRSLQEQQMLGGILLSQSAHLSRIFLKPEDFIFPEHKLILEAMQATSETPDLVTVTESLIKMGELEAVGGAGYLAGLTAKVPVTKDINFFVDLTRDIIKGS